MEYLVNDPQGYHFEDLGIDAEYILYIRTRNAQIAEFKRGGMSWGHIADLMDLSRSHVKEIGHKLGVQG